MAAYPVGMDTATTLMDMHEAMSRHFGPLNWWPGETPFEVMVGAILTQNTNWKNVEKAIANLKAAGMLDPKSIDALDHIVLAELIRPAGYYNVKSVRLKAYVRWFVERFDGDADLMASCDRRTLREEVLARIRGEIVTETQVRADVPKLSLEAQLAELAGRSIRYVEPLKADHELTLPETDIAVAWVLTEVTKRGLSVTTDQIARAVRAAIQQQKAG